MKFKAETGPLARALGRVQGPLKGKKIAGIQQCLALEASTGKITIAATDAEMAAIVTMPAEVADKGLVFVNGKNIYECVKAFPAVLKDAGTITTIKSVEVPAKGSGNVEIECAKTRYRLPFLTAGTMPTPDLNGVDLKQVGQAILAGMIKKAEHAMSTDQTRYNLCGMYFEPVGNGQLRIVATDGHRVFYVEGAAGFPEKFTPFLASEAAIAELKHAIATEKKAELGWDHGRMIVSVDNLLLRLPLLDASFPDYKQVIPEKSNMKIRARRQDILNALNRLMLLHKGSATPQATFAFDRHTLVLSSTNMDMGEAREEIDVDYDGGAFRVGFNAGYVSEALGAMETDMVHISLVDQLSPGTFSPVDAESKVVETQKSVIMPMRI